MDPRHLATRAVVRVGALRDRIRRAERLEMVALGRWIENTNNLPHLSILLVVPALIVVVMLVSNSTSTLSLLLFPSFASRSHTLLSDPKGRHASSVKFAVALMVGALYGPVTAGFIGWAYGPTGTVPVHPSAAALAIFLAGATTRAPDVEAPSVFSTVFLMLATGNVNPEEYVVSISFVSVVIAIAFTVWREQSYERRAEYLYRTIRGDDRVLVSTRGKTAAQTAFFAA